MLSAPFFFIFYFFLFCKIFWNAAPYYLLFLLPSGHMGYMMLLES